MRFIRKYQALIVVALLSVALSGCFGDDDTLAKQYADWKHKNEAYIDSVMGVKDAAGAPYFTLLTPPWAPSAYALIHWHNDTTLTAGNLSPMDNSTVTMTYELFDINGNEISNSFASADSIYRCKPNQNIVGVWYPLTQMHVGDSVTIVMPSQSGYGEMTYGSIPPYSTLVYNIKLKAIEAYEVP